MLVAVSGGCDSLSLLHLLVQLQHEYGLQLTAAHFDHALRDSSQNDAVFARQVCYGLKVPCIVERRSEPVGRTHVEEQGREDRYEFLQRAARQHHCRFVAVGHTADDQAETILHHILRGTGLQGLTGIPATRQLAEGLQLIRPLLDCKRGQLEEWLRVQEIAWVDDESNSSAAFTRNRIRHELLPLLRENFNPQIDAALLRLGIQADSAEQGLRCLAQDLLSRVVHTDHSGPHHRVTIDCKLMGDTPQAIVTRMFIELWSQLNWPRQKMTTHHWQKLADMTRHRGHPTGHSLPGNVQARWYRGVLSLDITSGSE